MKSLPWFFGGGRPIDTYAPSVPSIVFSIYAMGPLYFLFPILPKDAPFFSPVPQFHFFAPIDNFDLLFFFRWSLFLLLVGVYRTFLTILYRRPSFPPLFSLGRVESFSAIHVLFPRFPPQRVLLGGVLSSSATLLIRLPLHCTFPTIPHPIYHRFLRKAASLRVEIVFACTPKCLLLSCLLFGFLFSPPKLRGIIK